MCSSLFVVAYVQTLFFSSFLFTIFCGRTAEFFSPLFFFLFFLQALHYFSLNIIYKFAFNTHTLLQLRCCGTRTHKIKSSFSPLHWGCQTQLKSCDLVTRFRPDLRCPSHTHTHSWCRGRHRFVSVSLRLHHHPGHYLGNFSSRYAILQRRTLCHFLWRSVVVEPCKSPLFFPLSFRFH